MYFYATEKKTKLVMKDFLYTSLVERVHKIPSGITNEICVSFVSNTPFNMTGVEIKTGFIY